LAKTLTEPLFMLQYLMFWVWLVQKLYWTTIGNFSFCWAVISINYGILVYNYVKIKKIAEKEYRVKVMRDGRVVEISNLDIVPGDILEINKDIPCDCVLIKGDVLVNEANFTGENLPILKVKLEHVSQMEHTNHWIYEGSEVLKARDGALAVAIHTGYTTHKGRIIRKIVKHNVKEPLFTHKILIFFVLAYLSAVFIYLAYLSKLMSIPIEEPMIIFLLFEIISLAVPIGYIGVVNFFPGLSLIKLGMEGISGQEPYKVY
jgi:P-type E1-E2 ATPase